MTTITCTASEFKHPVHSSQQTLHNHSHLCQSHADHSNTNDIPDPESFNPAHWFSQSIGRVLGSSLSTAAQYSAAWRCLIMAIHANKKTATTRISNEKLQQYLQQISETPAYKEVFNRSIPTSNRTIRNTRSHIENLGLAVLLERGTNWGKTNRTNVHKLKTPQDQPAQSHPQPPLLVTKLINVISSAEFIKIFKDCRLTSWILSISKLLKCHFNIKKPNNTNVCAQKPKKNQYWWAQQAKLKKLSRKNRKHVLDLAKKLHKEWVFLHNGQIDQIASVLLNVPGFNPISVTYQELYAISNNLPSRKKKNIPYPTHTHNPHGFLHSILTEAVQQPQIANKNPHHRFNQLLSKICTSLSTTPTKLNPHISSELIHLMKKQSDHDIITLITEKYTTHKKSFTRQANKDQKTSPHIYTLHTHTNSRIQSQYHTNTTKKLKHQ